MLEGFQKYHVTVTVDNSSMHLQWSFLVPLIGGRYHIIPQLVIYKWYISGIFPANWGIIYHRSHLLREPGNSIDLRQNPIHIHTSIMCPPSSRRTAPSVATYQRSAWERGESGSWNDILRCYRIYPDMRFYQEKWMNMRKHTEYSRYHISWNHRINY